jgi:hypothetical protein
MIEAAIITPGVITSLIASQAPTASRDTTPSSISAMATN